MTEGHYHELPPAETSAAGREVAAEASFAGPWFTEPLSAVHSLAGLLLSVAADHFEALADALEPPVPIYADLTLLRGVLDSTARAWWLYEPGLDPKQRLARGMTEWAYSEYRAHQVLQVRNPHDTSRLVRIDRMIKAAEEFGMRVVGDRKKPAFEEGRPDTRALLKDMLGDLGVTAWQLTSGAAHGVVFAIMSRIDGVTDERNPAGLVAQARPRSLSDVYGVGAIALRAHQAAFDRRRAHYGWPERDWETWKEHVHKTLSPAFQPSSPD